MNRDGNQRQPDPDRTRSVDRPGVVRVVAVLALALMGVVAWGVSREHPADSGVLPECPSRMLGFYCPGCGSTRAAHYTLNGDLGAAFRHNPLGMVLGVPVVSGCVVWLLVTFRLGRPARVPILPAWMGTVIAVVVVVYFAVRNVPGEAFEWLRPPDPAVFRGGPSGR